MSYLAILSLTTGALCGIWAYLGGITGLLVWAGFAGCTSYFASGGRIEGFKKSLIANITGVFWASIALYLTSFVSVGYIAAIITAVATYAMCIQAKLNILGFIPAAFIGSFSTFAANGDWKTVSICMVIGAFLGMACEYSAIYLNKIIGKGETVKELVD